MSKSIRQFLAEGKKVEQIFVDSYKKLTKRDLDVVYPTTKQDMEEHWDVQINGVKIDVKGAKRKSRKELEFNSKIHWIELTNVNGDPGWLYGQADYFAFQWEDTFILVESEVLREHINNMNVNSITSTPTVNSFYSRGGRRDLLLLISSEVLIKLGDRMIKIQ